MEQLNFIIKNRKYATETVTIGRLIDLWKFRSMLSGGTYGQMYRMGLTTSDDALTAIDIESFFMSFCPDFIKDLKPGSIRELGIEDYKELRDMYINHIATWMLQIEESMKEKAGE